MTMDLSPSGDLFESFLLDSWDALAQFEAAVTQLQFSYGEETLGQLAVLSHRIKGTTALYSFPQMSRLAALAERLLEFRPNLDEQGRAGLAEFLERLGVCLRGALERVSEGRGEGDLGLQFTELGGTALLRQLLQRQPQAFARAGGSTGGKAQARGDLNAELTDFVRDNAEVWEYFAPEAREHIEIIRTILESADTGIDAMSALFRSAHTLKGSSYMVGFTPLGDLGHLMEDVMSAVREGQLELDAGANMTLGEGIDLAERMLRTAEGESGDITRVHRHTRRKLLTLLGQQEAEAGAEMPEAAPAMSAPAAPAPDTRATVRVPVEKLDTLMDLVTELISARGRLTYQLGQLSDLRRLLSRAQERMTHTAREFEEKYLNPHLAQAETSDLAQTSPGGTVSNGTVTSTVSSTVSELFDELEFDSYNDLNIVARSVSEISADLGELQLQLDTQLAILSDEGEQVSKLTRTLRGEVARARRVPFGQAVTRLRRWARTRSADKPFRLEFGGEAVEVDTFVLDAIVDPLLHLLNNSLIHGIEPAERRLAAHKPAEGQIGVRAAQHGAFLEIEVQDDGAGIDLAAVREKARGRVADEELARMNDEELAALIFLPGLSTAAKISAEAGRGVGMDVVASNLRRLGGEVLVHTASGRGTTFTLRVPLTQQITELLLFRAGGQLAGVAIAAVRSLRSVDAAEVSAGAQGETIEVDGEELALYRLATLWGYAPVSVDELQVIVLGAGGRRFGVVVDEFLDLEELAVRAGGPLLEPLGYLGGTAVSSSGEVVLLLDPAGIENLAGSSAGLRASLPAVSAAARQKRLLLVDDSVSVRKVVARMLERAGHVVITAADGYEALELLRADQDFDLILTDLEMPRVSGYELIEEVRRRSEVSQLPIVVMTTRAGDKHQQLARSLGATEYFSKPIDEARLIARLAELMNGVSHRA